MDQAEDPILASSVIWTTQPVITNTIDNASLLAECDVKCECPELLLKTMQWVRLVVLHVARSYYTRSLILAILPLLMGVAVGWSLGRRKVRRRTSSSTAAKETRVRKDLKSDKDTQRESKVDPQRLPRHIAVVMDGNRRYGRKQYGDASSGHWDGCQKLMEFAKWCLAEEIPILTVYAFSTENWKRDPREVAVLMKLFVQYCEELRVEAIQREIRVSVLSTEVGPIPSAVKTGLQKLEKDTKINNPRLQMNICVSYGSRGELTQVCRSLAQDCADERLDPSEITAETISTRLCTNHVPDPCLLIRTSGEVRISNFLLWQIAYSELFFMDKNWPEIEKQDLLEVLDSYANGRQRRFGK